MVPRYDLRQTSWGIEGLTKPDPKERAAQIVAWAIGWPWNVVWALCVYNPFRYAGEFLLQELQSALFEISNGQFSEIERDLSLESTQLPAPTTTASANSERLPQPIASAVSFGEDEWNRKASDQLVASAPSMQNISTHRPALASATDTAVNQTASLSTHQPWLTDQNQADQTAADSDTEPDADDSYSWTPPVPSSQFSIADERLRGVRPGHRSSDETTASPADAEAPQSVGDPWFQSHPIARDR